MGVTGADWTSNEIDLIVADYFSMLCDEIAGRNYSKAEHNRALQGLIDRSKGSIEFKHQNISAILLGLGQPWIDGYKPAANFQSALVDGIRRWLDRQSDWLRPVGKSSASGVAEQRPLWIGPPPALRNEPALVDPKFLDQIARKYDAAERDARNRALGKAGEELILSHEQFQLRSAGRPDLAAKVRWTAVEDGDGFGYDIHSFSAEGCDRLIEVKTTNGWERTPFNISRNELNVASTQRDIWHLVRVWNFAKEPKAFALRPPLEQHVKLDPTSFLASLR